jgi:hypothetical protein
MQVPDNGDKMTKETTQFIATLGDSDGIIDCGYYRI